MVRITRQMWNEIKGLFAKNAEGRTVPSVLRNVIIRNGETTVEFTCNTNCGAYTIIADRMFFFFDYLEFSEGIGSHRLWFYSYVHGSPSAINTGMVNFEMDDHDEHSLVYNNDMVSWIEDKGLTYTEARRYIMSERGMSAEKIAEAEGQGVSRGAVALSINSAKDKIFARKS